MEGQQDTWTRKAQHSASLPGRRWTGPFTPLYDVWIVSLASLETTRKLRALTGFVARWLAAFSVGVRPIKGPRLFMQTQGRSRQSAERNIPPVGFDILLTTGRVRNYSVCDHEKLRRFTPATLGESEGPSARPSKRRHEKSTCVSPSVPKTACTSLRVYQHFRPLVKTLSFSFSLVSSSWLAVCKHSLS